MEQDRRWLDEVAEGMKEQGISAPRMEKNENSIVLAWDDCCSLAVDANAVLTCAFRTDLEDIRLLVSDDTTEDLSDDELCRMAREELRPVVDPLRRRLLQEGFEERFESDRDQYAILYKRSCPGTTPKAVCDMLKWCSEAIRTA